MEAGEPPRLELTVTDVQQSAYCRRLPYYHFVLPVTQVATYKMRRGVDVQAAAQALERRRGFREYGLSEGERLFGLRLRSPRLALSGQLDLLVKTPQAAYPVDFKDSHGSVRANHRVQLAAYALLIEDVLGLRAPSGYIYLVPRKAMEEVPLGATEREDVLRRMEDIRRMAAAESLPPPTKVRARCSACEYRNYCGDVW